MPVLLSIEALQADKYYVEKQLSKEIDDKWGSIKLMWKNRLADINEQIEKISSSKSNLASVALVFNGPPVIGSADIGLDFSTDVLDHYQKIISLMVASNGKKEFGSRGKIPGGTEGSKLFIRDIVRGSMGFILEEVSVEPDFIPTTIKAAVENTTVLLKTLNSESETSFEAVISNNPPRIITAVQKFAEILHKAKVNTEIFGDEEKISLSAQNAGEIFKRLNEVTSTESIEKIPGTLLGILPESLSFELKLSDSSILKASVTEEIADSYLNDPIFTEQFLHKPVFATILVTRNSRNGRTINEFRILEKLETRQ